MEPNWIAPIRDGDGRPVEPDRRTSWTWNLAATEAGSLRCLDLVEIGGRMQLGWVGRRMRSTEE